MKPYQALVASACFATSLTAAVPEQGGNYYSATAVAMNRMMAAMHSDPSGNIDRDFVAMMVPHHQGAIDMAVAELRYGRNPQLKRIAQEIIVDQQQEIAAMHLAVGDPLPEAASAPTQSCVHERPRTL
jgi:uncharacterized protein (DUF305 family)